MIFYGRRNYFILAFELKTYVEITWQFKSYADNFLKRTLIENINFYLTGWICISIFKIMTLTESNNTFVNREN